MRHAKKKKQNICNYFRGSYCLSSLCRRVYVLPAAFRIRTNLLFNKMHSHDFGNAISLIACEKFSYMADGSSVGMKY